MFIFWALLLATVYSFDVSQSLLNESGTKDLVPASEKIPVCLISSWENGRLPPYASNMFETLKSNKGYAKLFLFHFKTEGLPLDSYPNSLIEFVDIAEIEGRAYATNGFAGFLAIRICTIFGVADDPAKIQMIEAAIEFLQHRPKSAPAIVQLRGMFGRIFSSWVNSKNCLSWAWTDLDILLGDLSGWLKGNNLAWEMDVFTIAGID